jgi:hypothetical protein
MERAKVRAAWAARRLAVRRAWARWAVRLVRVRVRVRVRVGVRVGVIRVLEWVRVWW